MSALFPNVPIAIPGIPPVLRRGASLVDAYETLATADSGQVQALEQGKWGIYSTDGEQVLFPDSVTSFEVSSESRILDYAVAPNSFESYNKVEVPFETRVVMTKGGSVEDRAAFLESVDLLRRTLDLYDVVTPERTYLNVNFERVSLSRSAANGAGMVTVEMSLREVRETATAAYSTVAPTETPTETAQPVATPPPSTTPGTVKQPAAARKVNRGAVQPKKSPTVYKTDGALVTPTAVGGRGENFNRDGRSAVKIGDGSYKFDPKASSLRNLFGYVTGF